MLSCREISELVSQSLDRKLPLRQRLSVRFHLGMCRFCSGFRRQLLLLSKAATKEAERVERDETSAESPCLSAEARERIQKAIDSNPS